MMRLDDFDRLTVVRGKLPGDANSCSEKNAATGRDDEVLMTPASNMWPILC
jgi:hypothetical protein